jgi:serine/threonine-protein kinase
MELLDGETLASALRRDGPLLISGALPILTQLVAGISAAHRAGIVHRDFKSANIFLTTDQRVVITDFGLARPFNNNPSTYSSIGLGTPAYMFPDHIEGGTVGLAADQYSLGVVMYEMVTGVSPHQGNSPLQVVARRLRERLTPPRERNRSVPRAWDAAILRGLQHDPNDRLPNVDAVLRAVSSPPRHSWKPWAIAAATVTLLTAAAVILPRFRPASPIPAGAQRWFDEGATAARNGSWLRARHAFQLALSEAPNFAAAHARLAEALMELDLLDDARAAILRATELPTP